MTAQRRLARLRDIYPESVAVETARRLESCLAAESQSQPRRSWSCDDVWMIAYADQFRAQGEPPLQTLRAALDHDFAGVVNGVHILPFFPWSSDDGFSVVDYEQVDPAYGDWSDVEAIGTQRPLMVDAVLNHMSTESAWFQDFLADKASHRDTFRTEDPETDTSAVVRARTHPLLTRFDTAAGPRWVWTTFSADQVDLDYGCPDVLLRMIEVILGYARRGATAIRLDAVGFCWKDAATPSIHLPQTHAIVQLIAECLDEVHPGTAVITETNVPHEENISYLGGDRREAQAVYQFPLAPLVAHAVRTGDVGSLVRWADRIDDVVGAGRSFLNFLASHDGIGLRPAEGLLDDEQIGELVAATRRAGGTTTDRLVAGGGTAPYELNVTWYELMAAGVDEDTAIARHLASHAIMLALPGIAAIYAHSLVGSRNDVVAMSRSGIARRINRRRFDLAELRHRLARSSSIERRVLDGLRTHVEARRSSIAFHPVGACSVDEPVSGVVRIRREHSGEHASCIVNLGRHEIEVDDDVLPPLGVVWNV